MTTYVKLASIAGKMCDKEAREYLLHTAADALTRGDQDATNCEMIALMEDKYRKICRWLHTLKKVVGTLYVSYYNDGCNWSVGTERDRTSD